MCKSGLLPVGHQVKVEVKVRPKCDGRKTHRKLAGDGVESDVDGVLKVGGGGDLGPVLVDLLACWSKVKSRQHTAGDTDATLWVKLQPGHLSPGRTWR